MSQETEFIRAFFTVLTGKRKDERIDVHFNPVSLQYQVQNQMQQQGGGAKQYVSSSTGKLTMDLVFDTTHSGVDVRSLTVPVARLMEPEKKIPPVVAFEWGAYKFEGTVEGYKETIELFSPNGVPLRAALNLTLGAKKESVFAGGDSKRKANVDGALKATAVVVPSIDKGKPGAGRSTTGSPQDAATRAGSPSAARALASANGAESMRFPTGGSIAIPDDIPLAPPRRVRFGRRGDRRLGGGRVRHRRGGGDRDRGGRRDRAVGGGLGGDRAGRIGVGRRGARLRRVGGGGIRGVGRSLGGIRRVRGSVRRIRGVGRGERGVRRVGRGVGGVRGRGIRRLGGGGVRDGGSVVRRFGWRFRGIRIRRFRGGEGEHGGGGFGGGDGDAGGVRGALGEEEGGLRRLARSVAALSGAGDGEGVRRRGGDVRGGREGAGGGERQPERGRGRPRLGQGEARLRRRVSGWR